MPVYEAVYAPFIWAVYALALVMIIVIVGATALASRAAKRANKRVTDASQAPASNHKQQDPEKEASA